MYDFSIDASAGKPAFYAELAAAARTLTADEPDAIANMANVSALVWHYLPDLNWAGFYRLIGDELVLGPFQGKPACMRIPLGKGVCGAAAAGRRTLNIPDVHAFPGHIACDAASRSEIVLPVMLDDHLVAILDLDSPIPARFDAQDVAGLETLIAAIADRLT